MSLLAGVLVLAFSSAPIEKPVSFQGAGSFELYGTLSLPSNTQGHLIPSVLLLPGSGPTDRDGNSPEMHLTTDVLKQIAASLAQSGIASLRFDKRAAHVYAQKFPKTAGEMSEFFKWENFVEDATNGYKYLCAHQGFDPKRVGIIGHSEGAEIALQIGSELASTSNPPAAIVTLGGAGRPMGPILHEQISLRLDLQHALPPTKKMYLDYVDKATDQVAKSSSFPENPPPGLGSLFNETTVKIMHSYCTIDPAKLARQYRGPVLLINGADDTQVSAERDTPLLKQALQSRSHGDVEMLIVPNTSHNLKSTTGGNKDQFEGPVVPLAMDKIKQFLTKELRP